MPKLTIGAVQKWLSVLEDVLAIGQPAYDAVKSALAAQGIDAENAELDAVIVDADRRKALAHQEASGGTIGE